MVLYHVKKKLDIQQILSRIFFLIRILSILLVEKLPPDSDKLLGLLDIIIS